MLIVSVARHHVVAVSDQHALPLGVVGDELNIVCAVELDRLQRARAVVDGRQLGSMTADILGIGNRDRTIERIEQRARPVTLWFQRRFVNRFAGPVRGPSAGHGFIAHHPADFLDQVTFEVIAIEGQFASLVVMDIGLAQQIARSGIRQPGLVAIDDLFTLGKLLGRSRIVDRPHPDGPIQFIVLVQHDAAFAVAVLDQIALRIQDRSPQPGIDAIHPQWSIEQIVRMAEGGTIQRILHFQQVAADIID